MSWSCYTNRSASLANVQVRAEIARDATHDISRGADAGVCEMIGVVMGSCGDIGARCAGSVSTARTLGSERPTLECRGRKEIVIYIKL